MCHLQLGREYQFEECQTYSWCVEYVFVFNLPASDHVLSSTIISALLIFNLLCHRGTLFIVVYVQTEVVEYISCIPCSY